MRTPPFPVFKAVPGEPILRAFEAHLEKEVHPGPGVLTPLLPGRKALRPRVEYYYRQLCALPRRVRRALQRRYARPLAGVALLLALGQAPVLAATITVGGGCTLLDAVTAANTDAATGGCPAGSDADVIELTGNVTLSAVNNTTEGLNGLPSVTSAITLNGNGHTLQRSTVTGTPEFRLFHVPDTGNLTINQLTLTNGRVGSTSYPAPGGAALNHGTLTLANSTISGNSAVHFGGGLYNSGILTLTNSTISRNSANYNGGGVSNYGTLTLTNSTVSGNSGGGFRNRGAATLTDSTVSGNDGLGVSNVEGDVILVRSNVSGNSGRGGGGGLLNDGGTLSLTNSNVSANTANYYASSGKSVGELRLG
ncbi:MAG: right-handed parallel beta-helix repeat-containing protein [Gammaproteobacteria bacterium]